MLKQKTEQCLIEWKNTPKSRTDLIFFRIDGKYAERKDKARVKECFQSIPKLPSKENKKFQYFVVRAGSTASKYAGSLQWIEDTRIITRCYNFSITDLPLDGNAEEDVFKIYMRDCSLSVSMLEDSTQSISYRATFSVINDS